MIALSFNYVAQMREQVKLYLKIKSNDKILLEANEK